MLTLALRNEQNNQLGSTIKEDNPNNYLLTYESSSVSITTASPAMM